MTSVAPKQPEDLTGAVAQLDDSLRAKRIAVEKIPLIDLTGLIGAEDDAPGARAVAQEIAFALENIGFFYVTGHGVPDALNAGAFEMAKRLFALPLEEKMALHIKHSGPALRGYTELFGENTDPTRTQDLKEVFDIGPERAETRPFFGPNPWPPSLPALAPLMQEYLSAMQSLGKTLLRGIALSLGLPGDYFVAMTQDPVSIQRIIHYPSQEKVSDDRIIGIGAHTDYGCLTILNQDAVGGLQIINRDGVWIDAPHIPGSFVINIGDMVQRLTNDRYIANLHRVINTSGRERYSLPFFFDVDFETEFRPLPSCVSAQNPARYAPIICGAHKWARYKASFAHLAEPTAASNEPQS